MSEKRSMTPYNIDVSWSRMKVVAVVVPTTYAKDSYIFFLEYFINPIPEFCNFIDSVRAIPCFWRDGVFYPTRKAWQVSLVPDDTVIKNINYVLKYFKFVTKFLGEDNNKTAPPSFTEWKNRSYTYIALDDKNKPVARMGTD